MFSLLGNTTEEPLTVVQQLMTDLTDPELWLGLGGKVLTAVVLVIVALILVKIANRVITNFFSYKSKSKTKIKGSEKRNKTLINVLQNAATVIIWFVIVMMVLETFNLPVRTLLAGAGVVGLAVGFGAQSLVKDMITGFFIILENQFDKGDFVRINSTGTPIGEGEVIAFSLRSTKIQGWEGELIVVPNGSISEVVNFSRYNAISMLDINLSLDENIDEVESILRSYFEESWRDEETLVSMPEVLGLQGIENGESIMRVMLETEPMEHFGATRRMRKRIKNHLATKGIYISVPKMDIQDFEVNDKAVGD
ncbi:mechanosensitive ion channel family protein [Salinicoccus carnicancri]|uniref:mechanosensitive ion channel family protein n=1 Tax=Salinicoccus carnicancri TaxID=558170 RepID=UPI00058B8419|nr:mechanosensitive ion channel family protein [Salinicoccus carnicancri]